MKALVRLHHMIAMMVVLVCLTACESMWLQPPANDPITDNAEMETEAIPAEIELGATQSVSQLPYVYEPQMAVNPKDPEHLAAIMSVADNFEARLPDVKSQLYLVSSRDGGLSWQEQIPFSIFGQNNHGRLAFDTDGTLYITGLGEGLVAVDRANVSGIISPTSTSLLTNLGALNDRPWLMTSSNGSDLYVTYSGMTQGRYPPNIGILFQRSNDGGATWLRPVVVTEGVDLSESLDQRTMLPTGSQVLLGQEQNLAVVWRWSESFNQRPAGVWMATSEDGGQSFSIAQQIADSWSAFNTTFHDGIYYMVFKGGDAQEQQLTLAVSSDGGDTWSTAAIAEDILVDYDMEIAPGIDVSPNGVIDIVFYARAETADCVDPESYVQRQNEGWIDTCLYNVYYIFSSDNGLSFSQPLQINEQPIMGHRFVRIDGISHAGNYLSIASGPATAYVIWVGTHEGQAQAYMRRIER